jgi:hypothetical protein
MSPNKQKRDFSLIWVGNQKSEIEIMKSQFFKKSHLLMFLLPDYLLSMEREL